MADRNMVLQLLLQAKDQASGVVSGFVSNAKTQFAALSAMLASAFSMKEAAKFEKALDAIRARADESGPALDDLIKRAKDAAQTLGPEFGFSATEAAGGIKELIAAGFSADDSIKALKGTLALAAMEEIKVADAAKLISDAIAQFGLKAEDASKVADILAKSAGAVAATAVEMAEALKYTGTEASRSGLSLTETSAALDVLAKAGQRGSEAGTGLASVLSILNNPAHAATQALFNLGATSTELSDVLDFLQARGLNASETIALFGEQGGRVINTLLAQGGSKAIADFSDQIGKAGKSAEDTAKIMQQNFLGALDRFWESLKRVGVELATPKLEPFAKGLDALTNALNTFASNDRIQAVQKALADGFRSAYEAARNLTSRVNWDGIQSAISGAFGSIKTAIDRALTALQSMVSSLTGTLPGAANLGKEAGDLFKAAWEGVGQIAEGVANGLQRIATTLSESIAPSSQRAKTAMDGVTESVDKQATGFRALWQSLKTDAWDGLGRTWDSLTRGAGDLLAGINALAQRGSEFLAGFIRSADFGPVRDLFNAVADAAKRLASTISDAFPKAQGAGETFANSFTIAWSGVVGILAAVVSGTLKVVESIGRATFEVGKYFDRYSEEEISKIEANLNGLSDSAGEFAGVAARSFEASGRAMDRMRGNAESAEKQQQLLTKAAKGSAEAQKAATEEIAKQTQQLAEAKQHVSDWTEAVNQQKAEVERLAKADQSSEAAKQAHAAATQKLGEMQGQLAAAQGDYISQIEITGVLESSAAESKKALANAQGVLLEEMERSPAIIEASAASLEQMRAKAEATQKAYKALLDAENKKTLVEKDGKSVTEQVNEARKKASDALGVYNTALDANIKRSQDAANTAERQRQTNQAIADSSHAVIEASIKLAEAAGNENEVARLVAEQKASLVEETKNVAASYQTEAEAAQKTADALKLKYEALVLTKPLDAAAIEKAKEAAKQAQAQATAVRASAIEIAAKIPVMEKEAKQAAIMAGPVGQLSRLYANQTKEHERAADASERYYDTQLNEIDGAIRVAKAKGDEAEAAKLQAKQQDILIDQADALARARQQEAQDAQHAVDAKRLELAADGELSTADKEAIANLQQLADQKAMAATQAGANADATRKEAAASKEAAAAAKEKADADAKARAEAAADQKQLEQLQSAVAAFDSVLSESAIAAVRHYGAMQLGTTLFTGAVKESGTALEEQAKKVRLNAEALYIGAAATAQIRNAVEGEKRVLYEYANSLDEASRMQEELTKKTDDGTLSMDDLNRMTRQVNTGLKYLDQEHLDELRSAIADATDKMNALRQSSADALDEAQRALLQQQGNDLALVDLDRKRTLLELQEKLNAAQSAGDKAAIANLEQAIALQQQVYDLKRRDVVVEKEKQAAQQTNMPPSSTAAPAPTKTYRLALTGAGGEQMEATVNADPAAFLDRLERDKKRSIHA